MDVGSLMQENELQNNPPIVESTPCGNFETTATEHHVELANDDLTQKCHLNSNANDTSVRPQMAPLNQETKNFSTKTICEQSLTQHTMPAVQPDLSMPNCKNLSTMLFTGQTPANTLNSKLTGLFTIPTTFVGQVQNPLTYVAPISKGPIQPTAVAAIRIPMESPGVRLANMCSKMPTVPSLSAKLSSAGPSYEQSLSAVVGSFGALTGQTVPYVQYQPCSTNTETASSTATLLNSSSTPGSTQTLNSSLTQVRMQEESCTPTNSQRVYTSTGSANQTTTTSTTETQPKLVPVLGAKPQPKEVTENTSIIPEFQSGKVDAKLFRPRYYDINSLEIGTWKYQRKVFSHSKSRLKIIFSQRKFVYELQLNNGDLVPATGDLQMACIEVPFRTVVGLNISTSPTVDIIIEVDTVPAMWQGTEVLQRGRDGATRTRVQYNTLHTVNLTDGQLSTVRYHKVTILNTSITIRNHLMNFDPRFSALLRIPIKIDFNKPPPAALKPDVSSKRKKGDQDFTNEESPAHDLESNPKSQRCMQSKNTKGSLKVCSCTSGCSSKRCNCIKECRKCQGCTCMSCNNPLNILEEYGVNLAEASKDSCLMQNLPKINNLRALLRSSVATPCCDSLIPLSNCSGEVECPECDAEYRFSWCSRDLCDEEDRPRNHCAICQTCRDYRDQHCSRCNRCYFAGSYDFPCPCRGGNQRGRFMSFMF